MVRQGRGGDERRGGFTRPSPPSPLSPPSSLSPSIQILIHPLVYQLSPPSPPRLAHVPRPRQGRRCVPHAGAAGAADHVHHPPLVHQHEALPLPRLHLHHDVYRLPSVGHRLGMRGAILSCHTSSLGVVDRGTAQSEAPFTTALHTTEEPNGGGQMTTSNPSPARPTPVGPDTRTPYIHPLGKHA